MNYNVGTRLRIDGRMFDVVGKIQYQNTSDRCIWHEYRMFSCDDRKEYWLSADDVYREYSISSVIRSMPDANGYHEVDRGTEKVLARWGNVDVDCGECAEFIEYEDVTEEKIISVERWSDGAEFSSGYYVDEDEIELISRGSPSASYSQVSGYSSSYSESSDYSGSSKAVSRMVGCVVAVIFLCSMLPDIWTFVFDRAPGISKYVSSNSNFCYETSITASNGLKADVYTSTAGDVEFTAKYIISGIEGNTEDVTTNTEDDDYSVAILTKSEYCLIYLSEESDQVLVQVSGRKYVYSSDSEPYHSRSRTHRFYRRHYYSRAYYSDNSRYSKKYASSYSSFSDSSLGSSSGDPLNSYSSSVRQQSVSRRSSSGGGTNYGK